MFQQGHDYAVQIDPELNCRHMLKSPSPTPNRSLSGCNGIQNSPRSR